MTKNNLSADDELACDSCGSLVHSGELYYLDDAGYLTCETCLEDLIPDYPEDVKQ